MAIPPDAHPHGHNFGDADRDVTTVTETQQAEWRI